MAGEAGHESERLRRARDQFERGELNDAVLTLWNEGEQARAAGSRSRLRAVVDLALTIRDRSEDRVQMSAGQLAEHYERYLVAPHARPVHAAAPTAKSSRGTLFVTLAVVSAGLALVFSGSSGCDETAAGVLGVLVFPFLVAIFLSTGIASWSWTWRPSGRRKWRLAGSIAAGLVAGIAIFIAALAVGIDGCLD